MKILLTLLLVMGILGDLTTGRDASASAGDMILKMATSNSIDNTGLLDYLAPFLKHDTGIELLWIAVGSEKALKLGENCDVDGTVRGMGEILCHPHLERRQWQ